MSYYAWNWSKSLCGMVWWFGGVVVVWKPILVFSLAQTEQRSSMLIIVINIFFVQINFSSKSWAYLLTEFGEFPFYEPLVLTTYTIYINHLS